MNSTLTASNTAREAIQIAKSISSACYALRIKNIKDRNLQDARWALLMIAIKVLRHFGMEIMGMGEIQYM